MGQSEGVQEAPRYRAFVSYSHANARFAHWLHRKIEAARLPSGERLHPVFIDRAELAAGDLTLQVSEALADSASLVVVASPEAKASRWVEQEIRLFRQLHPDRPIFCALIAGEPDQAFPAILLAPPDGQGEPLAADFRKGRDGKRLALLKLVAGIGGEPLDRLVQRDAQIRQHRVMAVTAGLTILSLVLAGLLIWALRQRAEAQRQRAEAEGMVEFMLTDLRDRLKGVGRLDVMDAVNERAMEHYSREADLANLPADVLSRRSRILTAMGEDDFAAGHADRAMRDFSEAHRITGELLGREPANPDRLFDHAQNEYWLGNLPFQKRQVGETRSHWQAYRDLAERLAAAEPGKVRGQREVAYAEANLCALDQVEAASAQQSVDHCRKAVSAAQAVAQALPRDLQAQLDLATNLAWQADAEQRAGRSEAAIALRSRQQQLMDDLAKRHADDARVLQSRMLAKIGLAKALKAAGRTSEARRTADQAREVARQLRLRDPSNSRWKDWEKQIAAI